MIKNELNISDELKSKLPDDAKDLRMIDNKLYYKTKNGGKRFLIKYIEINKMNKMNIDIIKGKTQEEGIKLLKDNSVVYRVVRKDLINYIVTCDFNPERVNIEIDNDVITSYHNG